MGKKKKDKSDKIKLSDFLNAEQKAKYREFGEPDMSQNWLELFTEDVINDLFTIMRSNSDNQLKSEYISKELAEYGFYDVGLGTNILTMANPYYPGVVFKIALDDYGIADNFNDCVLSQYVPRYNRVFARDPSAIVSVQERLVLPTQYQMDIFIPRIIRMLKELSKYFLIADLSPDMFLNYGVTRDGEFKIIDGSDLYPLSQMKSEPRCNRITGEHKHTGKLKHCEGKMRYSQDFKYLICEKCGRQVLPLEFRPRKDVETVSKILSDGMTAEERFTMEQEELLALYKRGENPQDESSAARVIFVGNDDDEDDEDEELIQNDISEEESEEDEIEDNGEDEEMDEEAEASETDSEQILLEREEEPREVIVDDDEEDDVETDAEGFMRLRTRTVSLPDMSEAPRPEAAEPVEVDEITEQIEPSNLVNAMVAMTLDVEQNDKAGANSLESFVGLMGHLKKSDDELERAMYEGFLIYTRRAMNSATEDLKKTMIENESGNKSENSESTAVVNEDRAEADRPENESPISLVERANAALKALKESDNPDHQQSLKDLCEIFLEKSIIDDLPVENDSGNRNNNGQGNIHYPDGPHIRYQIMSDEGTEDQANTIAGILLDIRGNFEEAYDESGLPIYISVDEGQTTYLAVRANQVMSMISEAVTDAYADKAFLERPREESPDEDEEEDDE